MNDLGSNIGFFRSPPSIHLRTGFDKLRANGKILKSMALRLRGRIK
jgi:hypothetical protein